MVNWCPRCGTALADDEVEHTDKAGSMWHIKYPVKDSDEVFIVATTRPETMLGDTGVAVHPEDDTLHRDAGHSQHCDEEGEAPCGHRQAILQGVTQRPPPPWPSPWAGSPTGWSRAGRWSSRSWGSCFTSCIHGWSLCVSTCSRFPFRSARSPSNRSSCLPSRSQFAAGVSGGGRPYSPWASAGFPSSTCRPRTSFPSGPFPAGI